MIVQLRIYIFIYFLFRTTNNMFKYIDAYSKFISKEPIQVIDVNVNSDYENILNSIDPTQYSFFLIFIGLETENFLTEYNKQTFDKDLHPVVIMDLTIRIYLNAENIEVFYGKYFYGSYSPKIENLLNTALVNTVQTYKGDPLELLDDASMALYNSFLFMQSALSSSSDTSPIVLKSFFYQKTVDCPVGTLSIASSNYINVYPYLLRYEAEDQPIIAHLDVPITAMPYYSEV